MRALLRSIPLVVMTAGAACGRSTPPSPLHSHSIAEGAATATYDRYRRPDALIAAIGLHAGEVVADVGAGTGYLTFKLADAVSPGGRVIATDIDEKALRAITDRHDPRITTRLTTANDPSLEQACCDVILLAEVDHLLTDRAAFFNRLIPALKPGGHIAISNRVPYRAPVAAAAADRVHLSLVRETHDLPAQFLLLYEVTP